MILIPHAMVKANVTFTNLRLGLVFVMKDTLEMVVKERKPRREIFQVVTNSFNCF